MFNTRFCFVAVVMLVAALGIGRIQAADLDGSGGEVVLTAATIGLGTEGGGCLDDCGGCGGCDSACGSCCETACGGCCGVGGFVGACQPGLFFAAEYLHWGVSRPNKPYAAYIPPNRTTEFIGRDVPLNRDSGFRLNLGYLTQGCWEIGFGYTYFYSDATDSIDSLGSRGGQIVATQTHPFFVWDMNFGPSVATADSASAAFRLDYDVYDLTIGRTWQPDQTLSVRGFGGVRWAQIDQRSAIAYAGSDPYFSDLTDCRVNMRAWGLRTGGEVDWNIRGSCLSLFSRANVSLLCANTDTVRIQTGTYGVETPIPVTMRTSKECRGIVPVLEIAAGVKLEQGPFDFALGYEFANWFNIANGIDYVDDQSIATSTVDRGDLGFDGFFVRAGMTF